MTRQILKGFDSAYPGSMHERDEGRYLERDDHKSLAAGLIELIDSKNLEIVDLREQRKCMAQLLMIAAYPRRGTKEQSLSIQDFASLVQESYTYKNLIDYYERD